MRRAAKRDANHSEIVRALQAVGAEVLDLSRVGGGCPDLLVCSGGRLVLLELKNAAGRNRVEPGQAEFCRRWPVYFVRTPTEAVEAVAEARRLRRERGACATTTRL